MRTGFLRVMMILCAVGVMAYAAAGDEKKFQESFWKIYTSALRGDKVAEYQVGVMYERGMGVEKDQEKAAEWYEKSAWQGHVDAQYNLALMYLGGRGVEKNEERAMIWLAKAARQGDKEARRLLLAVIDGTVEKPRKEGGQIPTAEAEVAEAISPVTLVTKEGAHVCGAEGECISYKAKTTLTSKSKRGRMYKISGIGTSQGWKAFEGEGWIDEGSVEIRR